MVLLKIGNDHLCCSVEIAIPVLCSLMFRQWLWRSQLPTPTRSSPCMENHQSTTFVLHLCNYTLNNLLSEFRLQNICRCLPEMTYIHLEEDLVSVYRYTFRVKLSFSSKVRVHPTLIWTHPRWGTLGSVMVIRPSSCSLEFQQSNFITSRAQLSILPFHMILIIYCTYMIAIWPLEKKWKSLFTFNFSFLSCHHGVILIFWLQFWGALMFASE